MLKVFINHIYLKSFINHMYLNLFYHPHKFLSCFLFFCFVTRRFRKAVFVLFLFLLFFFISFFVRPGCLLNFYFSFIKTNNSHYSFALPLSFITSTIMMFVHTISCLIIMPVGDICLQLLRSRIGLCKEKHLKTHERHP